MKTLRIETIEQWKQYKQGLIDISQYDLVIIDQKVLKFLKQQGKLIEEKLLKEIGK